MLATHRSPDNPVAKALTSNAAPDARDELDEHYPEQQHVTASALRSPAAGAAGYFRLRRTAGVAGGVLPER
ncbi:hypothetical protein KCP69_23215 [Salmonella enterica subsp. enterica]|nr:hypothetical protein KCP69_23215 [Salmonella enterica subsp. enterica]